MAVNNLPRNVHLSWTTLGFKSRWGCHWLKVQEGPEGSEKLCTSTNKKSTENLRAFLVFIKKITAEDRCLRPLLILALQLFGNREQVLKDSGGRGRPEFAFDLLISFSPKPAILL